MKIWIYVVSDGLGFNMNVFIKQNILVPKQSVFFTNKVLIYVLKL